MEISNDKIAELLKNPEILGMIASLASGFSSQKKTEVKNDDDLPETTEESSEVVPASAQADLVTTSAKNEFPDSFSSSSQSDKRIALLNAIKPYVNDAKKDKVDSLVKAIGVAGVLNNYTGGMFGGLFGK